MDSSEVENGARAACDAELRRRAGNPAEARKLAEEALRDDETPGLQLALGLASLDVGDEPCARAAFERAFALLEGSVGEASDTPASEPSSFDGHEPGRADLDAIGDAELENAFLEAESRPDEMWNANHLAEAALEQVEEGAPEGISVDPDSPFATATVAGLLEEQGHGDEAQALREAIATETEPAAGSDRARMIATLERWLDNLRSAS